MKRLNIIKTIAGIVVLFALTSCFDKNAIIDQNSSVEDQNWTYVNKFRFDAPISDAKIPYNIYVNMRVTGDYKYSNMFILLTEVGPDKKSITKRYELTLADKDGAWLGEGSGNLYSYQVQLIHNYKFPAPGTYSFYVEQNMRDNPLKHVSDVGIRVEKAGQ